jgi:hypothetical protein
VDTLRGLASRFWHFYQRNYLAVLVLTTAVFVLQLFHLYWLFTDVVLERLFGRSFYPQGGAAHALGIASLVADYLEIPTLLSASLLYVAELRKGFRWQAAAYLVLLNTQWAHILWITDEVVVSTFSGRDSFLPWNAIVAWIAILIDFLEVPVIVDTLGKVWSERHEIMARISSRTAPAPPSERPHVSARAETVDQALVTPAGAPPPASRFAAPPRRGAAVALTSRTQPVSAP